MNDKTIELIDFISLLNADGEISKKEKIAILAKAKSLEIGPEEAEVIIDQFTTNPESVMTIVQKHRDLKKSGAPIENIVKKRASQDINLSLPSEIVSLIENESFKKLNTLSYDEIYLRTLEVLFNSSKGEKVKKLSQLDKEINDLKAESKQGSKASDDLEKIKVQRHALFDIWTGLLSVFVLLWTYFSLIGLKTDWVSIVVGVSFSVIVVILVRQLFSMLINGYIIKEISLIEDKVDNISDNDENIQSDLKRLKLIKSSVSESLKDQKSFQDLVDNKSTSLEVMPFHEKGCNEIIGQTEISDAEMQKIITNCLFIRDAVKKESAELETYVKNKASGGLPSNEVFNFIDKKVSKINVYMTLLNGYCYSIQSLSDRTQFEHFLSENLINLSKKEKLQLQGMKKMIGQLGKINSSVSGLSKEIMMMKDTIQRVESSVEMLEYTMDDVRYSVDDMKYDIADSQKSSLK
ncbi:MAG: hypothetical protein ACKO7P_08440 [Bacteroidota bacterium]